MAQNLIRDPSLLEVPGFQCFQTLILWFLVGIRESRDPTVKDGGDGDMSDCSERGFKQSSCCQRAALLLLSKLPGALVLQISCFLVVNPFPTLTQVGSEGVSLPLFCETRHQFSVCFPTSQNVITFSTGSHQISPTVVSFLLIVFAG